MRAQGAVGYWAHLVPAGVPKWLFPIMVPVELLGLFTKPFALTVRLFANMVAGHIVIFFLIALTVLISPFIAPVSVAFALGIYLLELFVALVQAYVFTMLSAVFIGMTQHAHCTFRQHAGWANGGLGSIPRDNPPPPAARAARHRS